jgi:hypothetical protein
VYGPVRTVVWQGSAGDRRPYADLTGYSEVMPAEAPDTAYAKISFTFSRTC